MSICPECIKIRRTGLLPAFFWGSLFAAAVPIANMSLRSAVYIGQEGSPLAILLGANWQLMTMLNILLLISGACILYHTEYADNALQKIRTLPVIESRLFFGKLVVLTLLCLFLLGMEAAAIALCTGLWFPLPAHFCSELLRSFGYAFFLLLPVVFAALLIASACRNMWISLGCCILCVFIATMLPARDGVLPLFPFALPFRIFVTESRAAAQSYLLAAALELLLFSFGELFIIKIRRSME